MWPEFAQLPHSRRTHRRRVTSSVPASYRERLEAAVAGWRGSKGFTHDAETPSLSATATGDLIVKGGLPLALARILLVLGTL